MFTLKLLLFIMTNNRHQRATANSTFAIGGVPCFADTFVVTDNSVLRMNICAKNPAHRKSASR